MAVLHPGRVAWEGARTFVSAATTDACRWPGRRLGTTYRCRPGETRPTTGTASRLP
ncbi:hypothetical protein ACNF49_33310 [Actinomadura sp. ATCC 39365]|uniref:hypothetical protein n=1 Tax=Nonomuraea sp. NPDC005692 TaxID=3157168 RepID=UPI003411CB30